MNANKKIKYMLKKYLVRFSHEDTYEAENEEDAVSVMFKEIEESNQTIATFIVELLDVTEVKLCTECNEVYEPASAGTDIRCKNCGEHQNVI